MISKAHAKRKQDIKTKLMAAIAMLLVSSIMMVSSTYAWFTLSTAPEVTGINTAVGANGNLEMALVPESGNLDAIGTGTSDSTKDQKEKNLTWGNLVDFAPVSNVDNYGLTLMTLYPSQLNEVASGDGTALLASMLETPVYGSDGRIKELDDNTTTGIYKAKGEAGLQFFPEANTTEYGVRAVGVASGRTPRQNDYYNALSAGNTAMANAKSAAKTSFNRNGSTLATIAITNQFEAGATYTQDDIDAVAAMVSDLETGLGHLETAYKQYILAVAASGANANEGAYTWMKGQIDSGANLETIRGSLTANGINLAEPFTTALAHYDEMVTDVAAAKAAIPSGKTEYAYTDITNVMAKLAVVSYMEVNGIKANEATVDALMGTLGTYNGVVVTMKSGAGIYADFADQCGDFDATINIDMSKIKVAGSYGSGEMPATMSTDSDIAPSYLSQVDTAARAGGAPSSGATDNMPITEIYGYVIDLAFRTNAAESNLLLQQEGVDRIYDDNTNAETMGHGSTMTFKSTVPGFDGTKIKSLMKAVRIVFFDSQNNNTVLAKAKLDVDAATETADGWKAFMYLYEASTVVGYKEATDADIAGTVKLYTRSGDEGNYTYSEYIRPTDSEVPTGTTYYVEIPVGSDVRVEDMTLKALTQNVATTVSVLVYIDGNNISNADVAAVGTQSVTGTMNLQFASSAELAPMEYADLHQPAGSGNTPAADKVNVTVPTGVTGANEATKNADYTFTVDTANYTLGTVTVGGTEVTPTDNGSGSYTIPAAQVTGDIVINVTATATQP